MASLLVALTVTPALCKWLFAGSFGKKPKDGHAAGGHGEHDGWLVRKLKRRYEPALRASVRNRGVVLGGAGLLTVASLVLMSTFGTSFLPAFKEGTFTVFLLAPRAHRWSKATAWPWELRPSSSRSRACRASRGARAGPSAMSTPSR